MDGLATLFRVSRHFTACAAWGPWAKLQVRKSPIEHPLIPVVIFRSLPYLWFSFPTPLVHFCRVSSMGVILPYIYSNRFTEKQKTSKSGFNHFLVQILGWKFRGSETIFILLGYWGCFQIPFNQKNIDKGQKEMDERMPILFKDLWLLTLHRCEEVGAEAHTGTTCCQWLVTRGNSLPVVLLQETPHFILLLGFFF